MTLDIWDVQIGTLEINSVGELSEGSEIMYSRKGASFRKSPAGHILRMCL